MAGGPERQSSLPRTRQPERGAVAIGPTAPSPADLASENAKLRRELDRTRMERDVLKKAIGIFAEVLR